MARDPSPAGKAKTTVIGIEIPRDELALRIARGALGMTPPIGVRAKQVLDEMDRLPNLDPGCPAMGEGFRRAADQAVKFFHECVNAARQPS